MWWLLGLLLGALLGALLPVAWPAGASIYLAVTALAVVDAVIGGTKNNLKGQFMALAFWEGLLSTALLACALAWLGRRLDVQLHLAVAAALCIRIFGNLSLAREGWGRGL